MSISYTRHNKGSEKYHEVKLWGGGAQGAYLAHELSLSPFINKSSTVLQEFRIVIQFIMLVLVAWLWWGRTTYVKETVERNMPTG